MTTYHKAQQAHKKAQETGDAIEYLKAAELYRKAGCKELAKQCEDAAERLQVNA